MRFNYFPLAIFVAGTFLLLATVSNANAEDDDVFAARGKGVVTHDEFDARIDRIEPEVRNTVIRDKTRLRTIISRMLMNSQLAADARENGFDETSMVQLRMQLAAEEELANAWLAAFVQNVDPADYEVMAREFWQANPERFMTPETIDVTHLLVSTDERSEEDAFAKAMALYEEVQQNPGEFEALIMVNSDDPSAKSNKGSFRNVKHGDMVKPFEDAAFALETGAFSEPVKTQFGYHVIRLDARRAGEKRSYEEVEAQLVKRMRTEHRDRIKNNYLAELQNQPLELTEEDLEAMVIRYFGEDAVAAPMTEDTDVE